MAWRSPVVAGLAALLVACTAPEPEVGPATAAEPPAGTQAPTTSPVTESTAADPTAEAISALLDELTGHTISYSMKLSCFCEGGEWRIVERDGSLISAEWAGGLGDHATRPSFLLTELLRRALGAEQVSFLRSSSTTVRLDVDEDTATFDDEYGIAVDDLVLEE